MAAPLICSKFLSKVFICRCVANSLQLQNGLRCRLRVCYPASQSVTWRLASQSASSNGSDSESEKDAKKKKVKKSVDVSGVKPGKAVRARIEAKLAEAKQSDQRDGGMERDLLEAVDNVSKTIPESARDKVRSELLQKLQQHTALGREAPTSSANMSSLFTGISVERDEAPPSQPYGRAEAGSYGRRGGAMGQRESSAEGRRQPMAEGKRFERGGTFNRRQPMAEDEDHRMGRASFQQGRPRQEAGSQRLFDGNALNIFPRQPAAAVETTATTQSPTLFDRLEHVEMLKQLRTPPNNDFEQMIRWTRDTKLWNFPIDNEQGMDEESKVGFHEHIFVDQQLDERFPARGPIRHFMELVAVGLSKNPYFSAAEKRAHIDWYAEYFRDKLHLVDAASETSQTVDSKTT